MMLRYHVLWPGGNTTAILMASLPRSLHRSVAQEIMRSDPAIEQVGFIEESTHPSQFHLQMMGGEFCGNAARASSYLWWQLMGGAPPTLLDVSGYDALIHATVREGRAGVTLPGSFILRTQDIGEGVLVDCHGIRHLIVPQGRTAFTESLIFRFREDKHCLGIIYVHETSQGIAIDPFVWVEETKTLVHETGCGSGSIAAAAAWKRQAGTRGGTCTVLQPSGQSYTVSLQHEGDALATIFLDGCMEYRGMATVHVRDELLSASVSVTR